MKQPLLRSLRAGLLGTLCSLAVSAQAQQPTIDPAFVPTRCYAPADARQAVQQPDGKRVLLGGWVRVEGSAARPVVRYLSGSNQLDTVFMANIQGLTGEVQQVLPLAGGKLLIVSKYFSNLALGAVTRQGLLRLNADGTPDAGFDVGNATNGAVRTLLEQPDGKLLVGGRFTVFNGQPAAGLVRLNPNGSLDTAFLAAAAAVRFDQFEGVYALARQPNGKLLVSGAPLTAPGQPHHALRRLLPTGTPDATFDDHAGRYTSVTGMAVQPDGKVLAVVASGTAPDTLGGAPARGLVRLDSTGTRDASFQLDAQTNAWDGGRRLFEPAYPLVLVQPDGRILLPGPQRLLATGALDLSFTPDDTVFPRRGSPAWMQLLPTGQVLLAGGLRHYAGPGSPVQGVALLGATGTRDASFAPNLQTTGRINALARQADGKLLVAGFFDELNGQRVGNVARLNADGSFDATYSPALVDDEVQALALQADGKLLLGGRFLGVGAVARVGLARLLPTGGLDAAFAPVLTFVSSASGEQVIVGHVLALPGGQVVATGSFGAGSGHASIVRFDGATGQVDAGFQLPAGLASTIGSAGAVAVLPNGNLITIVNWASQYVPGLVQLLPSGAPDPAFTYTNRTPGVGEYLLTCLAVDAAGRINVSGIIHSSEFGDGLLAERLLPTGAPDLSFRSYYTGFGGPLLPYRVIVNKLLVQPNGRLLLGGEFPLPIINVYAPFPTAYAGTARVMTSGTLDASYEPTRGPHIAVRDMALEPNGAILAAGTFTEVGTGQVYQGLVRLFDANVLGVASAPALAPAQAWPVPAHQQLHLSLDATARPQYVQLLDALGRAVLTQPTPQPELTLNTASLRPGVYVLRVAYGTGSVSRRVVLE